MTLSLVLRTQPPGCVDGSVLTAERLRGRGAREISAMTLTCGRLRLPLGELFDVVGTGDDHLFVAGDLRRIDRIGEGMATGQMVMTAGGAKTPANPGGRVQSVFQPNTQTQPGAGQ